MNHATLYSFRRCPYAMRARLGLLAANVNVQLREIELKQKPSEMLAASPKGTVPVLVLPNGDVIEESLEIMLWALKQSDPRNLLLADKPNHSAAMLELIAQNDHEFKPWLDKYKYADRYPEQSQHDYHQHAMAFINGLESRLCHSDFLFTNHASLADYAILPFIRQFAHVDLNDFGHQNVPRVQDWLAHFKQSAIFNAAMEKYSPWVVSQQSYQFGSFV